MLSHHEPQLGLPDVEKFTRLANFSQIVPHYAKSAAFVRMLTHLRHALRFGHITPAMCRARAISRLRVAARDFRLLRVDMESGLRNPTGK
jgi:hypothetical protein